jgi:hypothetical protein
VAIRWLAPIVVCFVALASHAHAQSTPDRSLPGVRYAHQFPGADWCTQVNQAMADLPRSGGTVDLRGYTGTVGGCTTSIVFPYFHSRDGRNIEPPKPVTMLFGAATYRLGAHSINVVQSGAQLLGAGIAATRIEYSGSGTAIHSDLPWPEAHPHYNRYEGFSLIYTGSEPAIGMYLVRAIGNEIRSVLISHFDGSGINLDTADLSYGTLNTIDNVQIDDCANYGIVLHGANTGGQIAGTRIVNSNIVCNGRKRVGTNAIRMRCDARDDVPADQKGVAVDIRIDGAAATYLAGNYLEGKCGTGIGTRITNQTRDTVLMGNRFEALEVGISVREGQYHPLSADVGNSFEAVGVDRVGF